jgi:hypothetical protein
LDGQEEHLSHGASKKIVSLPLQCPTVMRPSKSDIVFSGRDWRGREVVLLKNTLKRHIGYLHFDELLVADTLKSRLSEPLRVIENRAAGSEQAIYDIEVSGHPYLQVNIKYGRTYRGRTVNLIVTFYGVDAFPPGRVIWQP